MRLPHPRWLLALILTMSAASCLPTADDIEGELERQISSVAGPWEGTSPSLTLTFQLQEGAGGAVSGSGTMKETSVAGMVPITVTGTYQRPQLSLTISGMNYEGRAVQGTFAGSYTTVGGITAPLRLTGTGYTKDVTILLQER